LDKIFHKLSTKVDNLTYFSYLYAIDKNAWPTEICAAVLEWLVAKIIMYKTGNNTKEKVIA
jgi:hypothetical protein